MPGADIRKARSADWSRFVISDEIVAQVERGSVLHFVAEFSAAMHKDQPAERQWA